MSFSFIHGGWVEYLRKLGVHPGEKSRRALHICRSLSQLILPFQWEHNGAE